MTYWLVAKTRVTNEKMLHYSDSVRPESAASPPKEGEERGPQEGHKKKKKRRERPGGGAVGKGGPERREQPGRTDNQATARQTGTATPSTGDHRGWRRDMGTRRRKTQFFVTWFCSFDFCSNSPSCRWDLVFYDVVYPVGPG